ncbi:MAG TPA: hypothetical protein ENH11_03295 [Candidatus Acetothermia bacterium]|nr:hypothetical protein [Candidatus Acetothermia bacterium]
MRYIVHHFKDRVQYFELWNEPNVSECGQRIEVEDYINLVRRAVPVIREEDPEAKVVIGAVTPLVDCGRYDYLFGILNSDVLPLVDAISWHVGAPSLEYEYWREHYIRYPSIVQQIKEVASAHGFTGEYIADELNWRSPLNPFEAEPWIYSPIVAAKYYARGMVMNLGMNLTVGVAGLSSARPQVFSTVRNLCTIMDGTETLMIPAEIQMDAKRVAYYGFALPNGDKLFAIWTDGVAQDEDPGIPATITFPGLTAKTVTGIDVLHGFEQALVFETDGDSTIVRDLLVKDYPALIRLSDVTMSDDYVETVGDGFHLLGDIDAVPDDQDYCPDWPGSKEANGC